MVVTEVPSVDECCFYCTTTQTRTLQATFEMLHHILCEVPLHITSTSFMINAVDPGLGTLTRLCLEAQGFDEYHYRHTDIVLEFGIRVQTFRNQIRGFANQEPLVMFVTKTDPNVLVVHSHRSDQDISAFHTMQSLKIPYTEFKLPEIVGDNVVILASSALQDVVKTLVHNQSSSVAISVADDKVMFRSRGTCSETLLLLDIPVSDDFATETTRKRRRGETSRARKKRRTMVIQRDMPTKGDQIFRDTPETLYSLSYLEKFSKAATVSSVVNLYFVEHGVCILRYAVDNMGFLTFVMAPLPDNDSVVHDKEQQTLVDLEA